jgi:hypothetical protein
MMKSQRYDQPSAETDVPFWRGRSRAIAVVLARRYVRSASVVTERPVAPLVRVLATVARSRSALPGRSERAQGRAEIVERDHQRVTAVLLRLVVLTSYEYSLQLAVVLRNAVHR